MGISNEKASTMLIYILSHEAKQKHLLLKLAHSTVKCNAESFRKKKGCNMLCPPSPKELARRLEEEELFQKILKQRSHIQARISILKNVFLQRTPKAKGYKN